MPRAKKSIKLQHRYKIADLGRILNQSVFCMANELESLGIEITKLGGDRVVYLSSLKKNEMFYDSFQEYLFLDEQLRIINYNEAISCDSTTKD